MGMGLGGCEDVMTIIMGLDPCESGMHGKLEEPCPTEDAITLVTNIRDMCDKWLRSAGKEKAEDTSPQDIGNTDDSDVEEGEE